MNITARNILFSLPVPILIILSRPLTLSGQQSVVLAVLVLTLTLWINKAIDRTYASLFMLFVFLLFGDTPTERVLTFPLSDNFILIVLSFLFSEGIVKSKLIDKILKPYIGYFATSLPKLFLTVWAMALIMIFLIPQPFIRLILLATIFREYLEGSRVPEKSKSPMLLAVILIAIFTNTFFLKGDIIMNPALINMSGITLSELQWTKYFLPPGILYLLLTMTIYSLVNKKTFGDFIWSQKGKPSINLDKADKTNLLLIVLPLILWALEGMHPLPGAIVILMGVILMYIGRILEVGDLKCIQWSLLIFLTATFSIGPVMSGSGTAGVLFGHLEPLFPQDFSVLMVLSVIAASIIIHMILGSIVTTMSVVLPGMALLTAGAMPLELVAMIVFVTLALHFILPFHSVHLVIGEGYGFFDQSTVIKTGLLLTILLLISIFAFYLPWWNFVGVF